MSESCLVADVGGTNTRVALAEDGLLLPDSVRKFRNDAYDSLAAVLRAFIAETGATPAAASVAVAGPVRDGHGHLTNRDWEIDRTLIGGATGAETVTVLNDLQAQGHALGHIPEAEVTDILPGAPASPNAARLVIGVGTGMNAAPVFRLGDRTLVPPSEAGHVTLPLQSEEELRLMAFLRDHLEHDHGQPGLEEVLSGRGFEHLYAWLASEAGAAPKDAAAIMESVTTDPLAAQAVAHFVRFLGRAAGNLALITLPFGGIYLIGGVARHFAPHLATNGFEAAFCDKGRFSEFMRQFPVRLVTDDYAALSGCAAHLAEMRTAH